MCFNSLDSILKFSSHISKKNSPILLPSVPSTISKKLNHTAAFTEQSYTHLVDYADAGSFGKTFGGGTLWSTNRQVFTFLESIFADLRYAFRYRNGG